jgi:hypothetical protein
MGASVTAFCDGVEPIAAFTTPGEYERLVAWIEQRIEDGAVREVAVTAPYGGSSLFAERWFVCPPSEGPRRLVAQDAPFAGVFERVGDTGANSRL